MRILFTSGSARRYTLCFALGFAILLASGCESVNNAARPTPNFSVKVIPAIARIRAGDTQQFSADILPNSPVRVPSGPLTPFKTTGYKVQATFLESDIPRVGAVTDEIVWSVNGIPGGNSTVGLVDSNGLYKAPAKLPDPISFQITASIVHEGAGAAIVQLENPIPVVTSVSPESVSASTFPLVVNGGGFVPGAQVYFGGTALRTIFNTSGQLTGTVIAPPTPGDFLVSVMNPDPGSARSSEVVHVRVSMPSPQPQQFSISVSPLQVVLKTGSSQQFTAIVNGPGKPDVRWSANGIQGGNEMVGTISPAGFYVAPHGVPPSASVVITAASIMGQSTAATAAVRVVATPAAENASVCGPPKYPCSRTDLNTNANVTIPNWGGLTGANTTFTDADFNPAHPVKYRRVTDANTIPAHPNFDFTVPTGGSGDENTFNADDSLFTVGDQGGNTYFFRLDTTTMDTGLVWNPGILVGSGSFSQSNPNTFYGLGNDAKVKSFDLTGCAAGSCSPPTASTLFDFVTACGVNPSLGWHGHGGIGGNDNVFSEAFASGNQDTGSQVAVWNRGGDCYLYDTLAGTVTKYPGDILLGTVSTQDRYTVHNVKIDPSGQWLIVVEGASCPSQGCVEVHAWQIGTTVVKNCNLACGGHFTETAEGFLNNSSRPGDVYFQTQLLFRDWEHFDTVHKGDIKPLATAMSPVGMNWDAHPGSKNDPLGTHLYPILACIYSPENGTSRSLQSEIIGWQQTPGKLLRFGRSFNSNFESFFPGQYCIGASSSTGQFYEFTSDGEGSFGSTSGGTACLKGGPPPVANHTYAVNDLVTLTSGAQDVFKVTNAGTTDADAPNWSVHAGGITRWGTAVFANLGPSTCRTDVILLRTQ